MTAKKYLQYDDKTKAYYMYLKNYIFPSPLLSTA